MIFKKLLLVSVLFSALYANPPILKYSCGTHDFIVDNEFHTVGINAGLYMKQNIKDGINQSGYFEVFTEYDKEELDPDHIPVWFRANYMVEQVWFNINESFDFTGILNVNWKMNTVSSVEQNLKAGIGAGLDYHSSTFYFGLKALGGTYYLEIDDDVPKENGFGRNDLGGEFKGTWAYLSTIGMQLSKNIFTELRYSEWYDSNEWLEKFTALNIKYKRNMWNTDTTVQFSIENTKYNLESYSKGNVPILPWDEDILLKLSVHIPF